MSVETQAVADSLDKPDVRSGRSGGWLLPGIALAVAGGVFSDGAFLTSAYRTQTTVSDDRFSYPWSGATAVTTSLVWGAAQVLIVIGLVGFARSGATPGRSGRAGARAAVAGAVLYVFAHAVSILAQDALLDDPIAIVAMTLFGVGTASTAVGLLMAGTATLRSRTWSGWRRWSPLSLGAWMVVMMPLQFTPALPIAVGVLSAGTIALGVALIAETAPSRAQTAISIDRHLR